MRKSTRQGLIERFFLPLRRLQPFHCVDCYKRFYGHRQPGRAERRERATIAHALAPLRDEPPAEMKAAAPPNQTERRNHAERRSFSRVDCSIPARLVAGSGDRVNGTVSSISLNGCFIEAPQAAPPGSEVEVMLDVGEGTRVRALVRSSLAAIGMGVEFTDMTVPNFRRLQSIARNSVRLLAEL